MNWGVIAALIHKDYSLCFRNKMFMGLTVIGLVFFLVIYLVMPGSVNEDLELGIYAPVIPSAFQNVDEEGLEITFESSEDALKTGVIEGRFIAGVVLPADYLDRLGSGQKPTVSLFFTPDAPEEAREMVKLVVQELSYLQKGQDMDIDVTEEILGPDMAGNQIPMRDRLRPLLAIFLILAETMFLASLISEEVEQRTIQAMLVTPVTIRDIFVAKGATGVSMIFVEATLLMAIIGGLNQHPLIIMTTLLVGALLVTGISFLMAAVSKDFMTVLGWGFLAIFILMIPAIGVMFPGAISEWVKIIPSYYLVDAVHKAANFGLGWNAVWLNLLILLGFCVPIVAIGILVLRRRFQ